MKTTIAAALLTAAVVAAGSYIPDARARAGAPGLGPTQRGAVPPDFECAWRALAYNYATQNVQPWRSDAAKSAIWDSLQLTTLCNQSFYVPPARGAYVPPNAAVARAIAAATVGGGSSIFVNATGGSDSNSGSIDAPLAHVSAALTLARSGSLPPPITIYLREGVHRLSATLVLEPQDSGLTISAYNGENAIVSGSVPLPGLTWTQYKPGSPVSWTVYNLTNGVYGCTPNGVTIINYTRVDNAAACEAIAQSYPGCTSFTWHDDTWPIEYNRTCWLRTDGVWTPVAQVGHTAGQRTGGSPPVWVADVSTFGLPTSIAADFVPALLYSVDGGFTPQRATRARYPNANPELDQYPVGWNSVHASPGYIASPLNMNTTVIHVPLPDNYAGMFQDYYWGEGGPCAGLTPPSSYWCQPNGRVAGGTYFVHVPAGIVYNNMTLPNTPYTSDVVANGGVLNYWRQGHWFTMMTKIASVTASNSTIMFGIGQFQGAEGENSGEDWYVEHILEELDAPNEFFFDAAAQKLYLMYNTTDGGAPPADVLFEMPLLQELIVFNGSIDGSAVVSDVSLVGITFTGAAPTYLAPHGTPSGGDWGLARVGAVRLQGTANTVVHNCTFWRVDGNGVFISGWNRNASVDGNEFVWIGDSAIASWGVTVNEDGTAGTQPWYNSITNNLCHEIGMWEKQSSCYFQAVTPLALVANNIFYNMPRASININDGFGGGTHLTRNVLWNTCRESSDHGAINSWDRVPYITTVLNGSASVWPAYNEIDHNLVAANYEADGGCVDNDDGSSRYKIHDNACVYGGHKSDFDGHQKISYNNVHAWANVYGSMCMNIGLPSAGYAEGYYNNTCIVDSGLYLNLGGCNSKSPSGLPTSLTVGNNTVYATGGASAVVVHCGGMTLSLSQWQALGVDAGTVAGAAPPTATIVQWLANVIGASP